MPRAWGWGKVWVVEGNYPCVCAVPMNAHKILQKTSESYSTGKNILGTTHAVCRVQTTDHVFARQQLYLSVTRGCKILYKYYIGIGKLVSVFSTSGRTKDSHIQVWSTKPQYLPMIMLILWILSPMFVFICGMTAWGGGGNLVCLRFVATDWIVADSVLDLIPLICSSMYYCRTMIKTEKEMTISNTKKMSVKWEEE